VTTTIAAPIAPAFHSHSSRLALLRAACVLALCAALAGGFLAQVWSAPPPADAAVANAPVPAGRV
jgi:hypothetical protein